MNLRAHSHKCRDCGELVECDGDLEANYDGWPESVCSIYHETWGGINPDFVCEGCYETRQADADDEEATCQRP